MPVEVEGITVYLSLHQNLNFHLHVEIQDFTT